MNNAVSVPWGAYEYVLAIGSSIILLLAALIIYCACAVYARGNDETDTGGGR